MSEKQGKKMSRLEELIAELCPNRVEYKSIDSFCEISRGKVISKDYIRDNAGMYPVYSSQTENEGVLGRISTYMYDGEYLTWTTDGANAGSVFYRLGKFSVTNVCGLLKITDKNISTKYIYYALGYRAKDYVNSGMGNPKLMSNMVAKIKIPVPPLPVQEEIVRILDNFAELTKRKQQYQYYRDNLIKNAIGIEWKSFDDICFLSAGGDVPKENFSKEKTEEYDIPVFSNGIGENALYGYTNIAKITSRCVTIAARGTIGYCELRKNPFFPIIRLICAVPKQGVLADYLKYVTETITFKVPTSGIPQLTVPMLKAYKVPVPPLEEQERIVAILDRFDALCNDLTSGLPAEIEARKKQYEYYRDKLLTFREAKRKEPRDTK
ncbi:MAG: restriction endonuclease subunit S [Desulfovibrionaceae bacterium]|nr:restriction endonuclease subunit S [Desulfovibrionaceae bacterium]